MKKFLLPKKALFGAAALLAFVASCGLAIREVEFSSREVNPGEELEVKISLTNESENNQADYYLLYAIRVPQDWTGMSLTVFNGEAEVAMKGCAGYAAMTEYCYPRDGYKWIAFQSKDAVKQENAMTATVKLVAGEAAGEYNLDIIGGGWMYDPSMLIDNGQLVLDLAFGHNNDFTNVNPNQGDTSYFNTSEYLFNNGTISDDEYTARYAALANVELTIEGQTRHIQPEIPNRNTTLDMKVVVKGEGGGIDGVAADEAEGEAEYFDFQGRKVANPNAGIFLVKRGNKVAKEVIR